MTASRTRRCVAGGLLAGASIAAGSTAQAAAALQISPTSVAFGSVTVGSTAAAKTVTLTNSGTAVLTLSSIKLGGGQADDFALTNACGASLAVGAACKLSVSFKPVSTGVKSASISITDNASGSPQSVALSGTGTASTGAPGVKLSATTLAFGDEPAGGTSGSKTVTVSNNGTATLTVTSIVLSGAQSDDFSLTNGCGKSLAAGASCLLTVSFAPVSAGAKAAVVQLSDNAAGSPQSVALSGTGVAVTATPTFSPAPGSYSSVQSVSISDKTSGAVIYYTTDGSTPTTASTKYTAAITVRSTETLSALAVASGDAASAVATGVYTIGTSGAATSWTPFSATPVTGTSGGQTGLFVLPSTQLTTASPVFVTHRTSIAPLGSYEQVTNPYSSKAGIADGVLWYSADGNDGKTHLYGVTLSSTGAAPTEKQISNLSLASAENVCTLGSGQTDYTDATTAWVILDIPGSAGCGHAGDKVVLVHYTDSATTTPASLSLSATGTDSDYVTDIIGPSFKSEGILALDTTTSVLSYYKDTTFTHPTTVLTGIASIEAFAGYIDNHYYLVTDSSSHSTLYEIEAPGTAKKIYAAKSSLLDSVQDAKNFYFLDENVLYKEPLAGGTPITLYTANPNGQAAIVGTDGTAVVMTESVNSTSDPTQTDYSVLSVPTASASSSAKILLGPIAIDQSLVDYQARMPASFYAGDSGIDLVYITRTTTTIGSSGTPSFAYAAEIVSAEGTVKQALTSNSNVQIIGVEQPVFEVQGITETAGGEGGGIIDSFNPSTLAKTALTSAGQPYHVPDGHITEAIPFADGQTQGIVFIPSIVSTSETLTGVFDLNAATIKILSIANTQISPFLF